MVRCTDKTDGDMAMPAGGVAAAPATSGRLSLPDRTVTWLTQVHGADVTVVDAPGGPRPVADGAVSMDPGVALAVVTADCAPVAFASPDGVIGIAHAGWRGLVTGVIEETVSAMRRLGAQSVLAFLGPCIHAECYAFGRSDLDAMAAAFGPIVRAETSHGRPALDIPAAVRVALERAGVQLVADADVCTSCSTDHWSWRARADHGRQATVVWRP
jgi:YfiH family protein